MIYLNVPAIGFVGKKGSGKSSCAIHLANSFPATIRGFSVRLKMMMEGLGFTHEQLQSQSLRNIPSPTLQGKTLRLAMQTLGTDWARNMMGQDIWVDLWKEDAEKHTSTVLVDDVRFINEAKAIKDIGGILIRIKNPKVDGVQDNHQSETEQDQIKCDLVITNDGTLEQLCRGLEQKLAKPGAMPAF